MVKWYEIAYPFPHFIIDVNYISMLELKLFHVSKGAPEKQHIVFVDFEYICKLSRFYSKGITYQYISGYY